MALDPTTLSGFSDEMEKIAYKAWRAGAGVGGGLGLTRGLYRENILRHIEEDGGPVTPEMSARRKKALLRIAAGTALGAGTGGTVGHYGSKAWKHMMDVAGESVKGSMKSGVRSGLRGSLFRSANPFPEGTGRAIRNLVRRIRKKPPLPPKP